MLAFLFNKYYFRSNIVSNSIKKFVEDALLSLQPNESAIPVFNLLGGEVITEYPAKYTQNYLYFGTTVQTRRLVSVQSIVKVSFNVSSEDP